MPGTFDAQSGTLSRYPTEPGEDCVRYPQRLLQVSGAPLEKLYVSQHRQAGCAALLVRNSNLRRIEILTDQPFRWARLFNFADNGAMIAYAGMIRLKAGTSGELSVSVRPRWPLAELPAA